MSSLLRPITTDASTNHCKLFEIDNQINSKHNSNSTKQYDYFNCSCRKSSLKDEMRLKRKNDRHHHRKSKAETKSAENFPFEHRSKTSKKRKLKKEKFGKSEDFELKASINKSSKLDDSASNLSYMSLASKKGKKNSINYSCIDVL